MSRVLVIGATGLAGREIARECVRRGIETRGMSRRPDLTKTADDGVDYLVGDASTRTGLAEAMDGVSVVIDAMDGKFGKARKQLPQAARNIADAAAKAGVGRAVVLSIVNVDRVRFGYYEAKTAQEWVYRNSATESVILRSTQFHDLVTGVFDAGRKIGITPFFRGARFQTIATTDVARVLINAALAPDAKDISVGGPETLDMAVMARIYRQFTHTRGPAVPLPVPGALGRYWRNGQNLVPENAVHGSTYAECLAARQ